MKGLRADAHSRSLTTLWISRSRSAIRGHGCKGFLPLSGAMALEPHRSSVRLLRPDGKLEMRLRMVESYQQSHSRSRRPLRLKPPGWTPPSLLQVGSIADQLNRFLVNATSPLRQHSLFSTPVPSFSISDMKADWASSHRVTFQIQRPPLVGTIRLETRKVVEVVEVVVGGQVKSG